MCDHAIAPGSLKPGGELGSWYVIEISTSDGLREIVRESKSRRVGADKVAEEVHPEPLQGAVVEVMATTVSGRLGVGDEARLRGREIA